MDRASEDDPSTHPLFLHLMCSLRDRNLAGSEMGLLPVDTLPTCLCKLHLSTKSFSNARNFDLGQF